MTAEAVQHAVQPGAFLDALWVGDIVEIFGLRGGWVGFGVQVSATLLSAGIRVEPLVRATRYVPPASARREAPPGPVRVENGLASDRSP